MEDRENVYEAIIEEFETMTRDAGSVQREILKKILEENGETEYLQSCGLDGRTDPKSYKACVPIASHKDFEPYIQRIADGDKSSILTRKPITTLSLSSGTTQGKPKFVPFNDELMEIDLQTIMTTIAFRNREYPTENGKALDFIYGSKPFQTNGGLTAGTVSSNLYRHSKIKEARPIHSPCTSPDEVMFSPDFHQTLYCHLLCALICRNGVHAVTATFAHSIVQGLRTLELVWEELVTDIGQGTLSERITVPPVRSAVAKLQLRPDPELANKIYDTCLGLSKLNWYGLIPELFPNAKYVNAIMTGSMEPYLTKLRHYAGGLPLVNGDYVSSEGYIGANVNPKLPPELATFTPLPNSCYYEFIPIKQEESLSGLDRQPVGLTEVKVGNEYEIIITTFAGLYRYQLGDVVKVKGFHNSIPELQFICRKNLLLSINIDKNTERDLQISVDSAAKLLAEEEKQEVVDFTSQVDSSTEPSHYVIFWEISGEAKDGILKECCNCLDKSFLDAGYITSRKINAIGPLELRIVKRGTFNEILHHYVGLGTAVSQFKSPRCVGQKNTGVLKILSSNIVKSYFSTAY